MNRNSLKTPTGRRQTSWLFTKRAGVEFGATNPSSGREEDLNPEPPAYKCSALTTRPRSPPRISSIFRFSFLCLCLLIFSLFAIRAENGWNKGRGTTRSIRMIDTRLGALRNIIPGPKVWSLNHCTTT